MIGIAQRDKSWSNEISDKHVVIVPHITKVDEIRFKGMYRYFYPPRIGLDFYFPENYPDGNHDFIPNLELGDVARLVRILDLVKQDETFDSLKSGRISPFKIGLAFENDLQRKILLRAKGNLLAIRYCGIHRKVEVDFEYCMSRECAVELTTSLKELLIEYIGFIQKYVILGKIDRMYRK